MKKIGNPHIFHVVGHSNTGKTTLISALIPAFKHMGCKVGVVKSCHQGYTFQEKEKDSDLFTKSGSDGVGLIAPQQNALYNNQRLSLKEFIEKYFMDYDVVFVEGFKRECISKKILMLRKGISEEIFIPKKQLLAVVSDFEIAMNHKQFRTDQINSIFNYLESIMKTETTKTLKVMINNHEIKINDFVCHIFTNVVEGMINSLKTEDKEIHEIKIELKKNKKTS